MSTDPAEFCYDYCAKVLVASGVKDYQTAMEMLLLAQRRHELVEGRRAWWRRVLRARRRFR